MIRKSAKAWLAMLVLTAAGCNAVQDECIKIETSTRNCVLAMKGWHRWSDHYDHVDHKHHFAKGFKEGYTNILEGGKGCQPTLPPRWYWKPCYQTPAGRCKIAAWFDGFTHGAVAAQQDGYGNLQQLPISPTARANWMTRQAPPAAACFSQMNEEIQPLPMNDHRLDIHGEFPMEESTLEMPEPLEPPPGNPNIQPARPYDETSAVPEN
jgi:hypothetical protein